MIKPETGTMETDHTSVPDPISPDIDNTLDPGRPPQKPEPKVIACIAALLGFFLTATAFFERPIIIDDGIMYLDAARHLLSGDLGGAYHIYSRLPYPALIAAVSAITSLPLEESAWLVNSFFNAILAYAFVAITGMLGAGRNTLLFSAFLILTLPDLAEMRADVMRDPGFWSFHLLSALLFLRFMESGRLRHALGWGAAALAAILFRSQGIAIMLLLPFVLLWASSGPMRQRARLLAKAHAVTLATFLAMGIWFLFGPTVDFSNYSLGGHPLLEPLQRIEAFLGALSGSMAERINSVSQAIPRDYALSAIVLTLLFILTTKITGIMTPFYWGLYFVRPLRQAFRPPRSGIHVLAGLLVINLCILLIHLVPTFHMSERWVVPAALVLLLPVPFFLSAALRRWKSRAGLPRWERILYPVLALGLVYLVLDGIISTSPSKAYLRDAGHWVKEHLPPNGKLFANNRRINYYAGYPVDWRWTPSPIASPEFPRQIKAARADLYAIQAKDDSSRRIARELLHGEGLTPLREFSNGDGDWVIVYGRTAPRAD